MIDMQPRTLPVEKAHSQLVFQFRQCLRNGSLCHEQCFRRLGHGAIAGNGNEDRQLFKGNIHRLIFLNIMSELIRFSK